MPFDVNVAVKELEQKRPDLFGKSTAAAVPNSAVTKPTAIKPGAPKAETSQKLKIWDEQFQPLIDKNGWDKNINYSNSLHMMKAINGRYNSLLGASDLDESVKETIKSLTNNSWAAMKELKKISQGQGDNKLFNTYRLAADKADSKLVSQIGYGLGKNYVYNNKDKTIIKKSVAEKNYQGWEEDQDAGGSTEANAGGGGVNKYAGYIQLKSFETRAREQIKETLRPINTTWTQNTFKLLNASDEQSDKYDTKLKNNAFNLSVSALRFVSKFGTQSGNLEIDKQNKKTAANLLVTLNNPNIGFEDKIKFLKKTSQQETNVIQDMISQMGYYGSRFLYSNYKNVQGKKAKYFENGADKYAKEGLDGVDNMIENADLYFEQSTNDRLEAKKNVYAKSKTVYKNLVNDKGVITDYNSWLESMGYNSKTGDLGELKFSNKTGDLSYNPLLSIYDQNNSWTSKVNTIVAYGQPVQYLNANGRVQYSKPNKLRVDDKEAFHKVMRKAYNSYVKEYKAEFSYLNDPAIYKGVIQGVNGFGNEAFKAIKLATVDMSMDKDGNLIHTQDFKGNNANNIFKLMLNSDGSINIRDITLLNQSQINEGKANDASRDYLISQKDNNEEAFSAFFGRESKKQTGLPKLPKSMLPKKDLSDIKISFSKNASVDYHGKYTFTNKKTGEQLVMVAPASYLNAKKDFAWTNSQMRSDEGRFLRVGKKVLPDREGLYKNAEIIDDNGIKFAKFKYIGSDGMETEYSLPIGDVNINKATTYFNDYVKNIMMPTQK